MSKEISLQEMRSQKAMLLVWVFLNSILLLSCNVLVGFTILGQSLQNSINPAGAIAGAFSGFLIGIAQWIYLHKYFSVSLLWILTCILGFAFYYAVNWYTGAILMAISQQIFFYKKFKDFYVWAIVTIAGIGIGGYFLAYSQNIFLYGFSYAFLTACVLLWYKSKERNQIDGQKDENQ